MLKEFWVIFDTCQYPEYYQDVHNLLALPKGAILRYDYKRKYLSEWALRLADKPEKLPILFVYAQKDCNYNRGPENSQPQDGTVRTVYVGTRLGRMLGVPRDAENYYFDFQVTGYPNNSTSALSNIIAGLQAKNEVPWDKWVCASSEIPNFDALHEGDEHEKWSQIVELLSSPPMQFSEDAFWRLKGPFKLAEEAPMNASVEYFTEQGRPRQARSYYAMVENETWRFELLSETGKLVTETNEGTTPHHKYSVGVRSSNDKVLCPIGDLVHPLRHYTGQMVEYSACPHPFLGRAAADIIFETEPQRGDWPVGPKIAFKHRLRRNKIRMAIGCIIGIIGIGSYFIGDSKLFEQLVWLKTILKAIGVVLLLLSTATFTGQIKFDK